MQDRRAEITFWAKTGAANNTAANQKLELNPRLKTRPQLRSKLIPQTQVSQKQSQDGDLATVTPCATH